MHHHEHNETHICPKTGKCCGRCKLAIAADASHSTIKTGTSAGHHESAPVLVPANVPLAAPRTE